MSTSTCASIVAGALIAGLLGCAHVPADDPAGSGGGAQSGFQPPIAGSASAASTAQAGTANGATAGSTQASAAASTGPSPDLLRQAMALGYRPEKTQKGVTVFCKEDAPVGTRFVQKQCVTQQDIPILVQNSRTQQDQIRSNCGGQGCGGPQSH
jgi:hypothetical protein